MASDVIESEAALKGVSDMNLNNRSQDFVTPSRTQEELGNRQSSSPSSSGVSVEGDEEELDELENSTASTIENGEEALPESPTKTRGSPQERTTPDNEEKPPRARSSTPVSLPQPCSPSGTSGRSVYVHFKLLISYTSLKCWQAFGFTSIASIIRSQTIAPWPNDCPNV